MLRRTALTCLFVAAVSQLSSGCCWQRPLFGGGCWPNCHTPPGGGPLLGEGQYLVNRPLLPRPLLGVPGGGHVFHGPAVPNGYSTGAPVAAGMPGDPNCATCQSPPGGMLPVVPYGAPMPTGFMAPPTLLGQPSVVPGTPMPMNPPTGGTQK